MPVTFDVETVRAEVDRRVTSESPDEVDLARRTIARLPPENWALEWQLPWWLGEAFGLEPAASIDLCVANLLGLMSIRLGDDLADGEVEAADIAAANRLREATYELALETYRCWFESSSPFWPALAGSMAAWRATRDEPDEARLATRGAPLRIGAYGAALLADRRDCWPILERCLDHALTAMVLYDHFVDWEPDLAAGRWNAFVASVSNRPQTPDQAEANRASVLTAMMLGGVVERQFDRIGSRATAAARLASALGVEPLARFLVDLTARTAEQAAAVESRYRMAGDRATELIFGR